MPSFLPHPLFPLYAPKLQRQLYSWLLAVDQDRAGSAQTFAATREMLVATAGDWCRTVYLERNYGDIL